LYRNTGITRTTLSDLLFGGLAGSTASLFCQPIDVIRTRLAAQGKYKASVQNRFKMLLESFIQGVIFQKYSGSMNAVLEMAREEGIYGFFRGLVPTTIMIFPQTAIQFYLYNKIKLYFLSKNNDRHRKIILNVTVNAIYFILIMKIYLIIYNSELLIILFNY